MDFYMGIYPVKNIEEAILLILFQPYFTALPGLFLKYIMNAKRILINKLNPVDRLNFDLKISNH